jgi:hypothetical protein
VTLNYPRRGVDTGYVRLRIRLSCSRLAEQSCLLGSATLDRELNRRRVGGFPLQSPGPIVHSGCSVLTPGSHHVDDQAAYMALVSMCRSNTPGQDDSDGAAGGTSGGACLACHGANASGLSAGDRRINAMPAGYSLRLPVRSESAVPVPVAGCQALCRRRGLVTVARSPWLSLPGRASDGAPRLSKLRPQTARTLAGHHSRTNTR